MADKTPKIDKPDDGGPFEVRFTTTPQLWAYLQWLSKNTLLGKSANDVAEHVLVQRLCDMKQDEFKAKP